MICRIWEEVLGLERVGVRDDFFRVGGDSILSIRLVSKIKALGVDIAVKDIFNYRNIQNILQHARKGDFQNEKSYIPFSLISNETTNKILKENNLRPDQIQDIYPASYLQSGMLIESFAKNTNDTYHDVFSYIINAEFNRINFQKVWHELINKNEQLRTTFIESEHGYFNVIHHSILIDSKVTIIDEYDSLEQLVNTEKYVDFDLASPGLFRLLILPNNPDKNFTLIFSSSSRNNRWLECSFNNVSVCRRLCTWKSYYPGC